MRVVDVSGCALHEIFEEIGKDLDNRFSGR